MAAGNRIDRVSVEFGANTQQLVDSIDKIIAKAKEAEKETGSSFNRMSRTWQASADAMINPTEKLEKKFMDLGKSGSYNMQQLSMAYGPILQKAAEQCERTGAKMLPLSEAMYKVYQESQRSKVSIEGVGNALQNLASNPLQAAQAGLSSFLGMLGPTAVGIGALAAGVVAAGVGIGKLAEDLSDNAVALRNEAMAAGMTTQQYQALKRVGVEVGVGMESLPRMLGMLNRELGTGTKMDFVKVLNALRISAGETAADLSHGVIPIIDDLGKRIDGMATAAQRGEYMNAAYNRRLQEIGVAATVSKGHVQDMMDAVIAKGAAYSEKTQDQLERVQRNLAMLGTAWQAAKIDMIDFFTSGISWGMKWAESMPHGIPGMTKEQGEEAINKQLLEQMKGKYDFSQFSKITQLTEPDPLAAQKRGQELARLIMEGMTEQKTLLEGLTAARINYFDALEKGSQKEQDYWSAVLGNLKTYAAMVPGLYLELANKKADWDRHQNTGVYTEQQNVSRQIAGIKELLSELGKVPEIYKRIDAAYRETAKTGAFQYQAPQFKTGEGAYVPYFGVTIPTPVNPNLGPPIGDISVKGHAALVTSAIEADRDLKKAQNEIMRAFAEAGAIQRSIMRDVTQGKLNELRMEKEITANIIPRNEYERYQVALYKEGLDYAIGQEEIRLKYAQKIYELEQRIKFLSAQPILGPMLADKVRQDLTAVMQQQEAEFDQFARVSASRVMRIHAEEYKRMIDTYKEYAGSLFDAIRESGQKGFTAILDWLKNTFANLLKAVFENVIANALQNTGIYQGIRKLLGQTYPTGGPQTGMDLFGGMTQAVEQGTSSALQRAMAPSYAWSPAAEEWQPENYVMAPEYVGGYSGGVGTLAIPGIYQLGAGTAAAGGGGGGWLSSLFGGSAGMASSLALGVPSASILGLMSNNAYAKGLAGVGLGVTALTGIGTLMVGGGMSTFTTALAANLINPITAAIAGAVLGGIALYKVARGPSTEKAGSKELMRDLGIGVGKDTVKDFIGTFMNPEEAWGIRKDILSSPQFLTQVGGKAAKAQGEETYRKFLKDLEEVKTSWGTFDFRQAFEIGDLTGDWSQLDKAFTDAFEHSTELQKVLPNWKDVLLVTGDAAKKAAQEFEGLWQTFQSTGEMSQEFVDFLDQSAASLDAASKLSGAFADQLDRARASAAKFTEMRPLIEGFQGLKDSLPGAISQTKSMYQVFLDTGKILPELATQITEYGGDLAAFQRLSDLAQLNADFQTMVEHFKETGEILPELRQMFKDFGGDLAVLDAAADLPNLMKGLTAIKDLASGIAGLQKTAAQQVVAGEWGSNTWGDLAKMGLDPSKLTKITDLSKYEKGWDEAVSDFQTKMKNVWDAAQKKYVQVPVGLEKGGLLEQALWQFGGPAGTAAIQNWGKGFNTVTPDLLTYVKSQMDLSYKTETESVLKYLGTAEEAVGKQIIDQTTAVTDQFDIVGANIGNAIDKAKEGVVTELDKILTAINQLVVDAGMTPAVGPSNASVKYYNELGKPYTSEAESYWQTGGAWYEGAKGGAVTPIQAPPWLGGGEVVPYLPTPGAPESPIKYPTSSIPAAATGGLVRVHDEEAILNREQTANLLQGEGEPRIAIYIDQRGSTFNAEIDMQRSIEKALAELRARGFKMAFAR